MEGDVNYAADEFLRALAADPTNPEIRHQAFVACLFAGRPEAARLAREEPNDEAAALLLGDIDARNGNWEAAEQRFALLPRQGVTQVLQPLLLAWAQYGGGHPDTALGTLRPFIEGDRFRAVYAFHAALIADLSNRVPEAGRLLSHRPNRLRRRQPRPRARRGKLAVRGRATRRKRARRWQPRLRAVRISPLRSRACKRTLPTGRSARPRTASPTPIWRSLSRCANRTPTSSPPSCCGWRWTCGRT